LFQQFLGGWILANVGSNVVPTISAISPNQQPAKAGVANVGSNVGSNVVPTIFGGQRWFQRCSNNFWGLAHGAVASNGLCMCGLSPALCMFVFAQRCDEPPELACKVTSHQNSVRMLASSISRRVRVHLHMVFFTIGQRNGVGSEYKGCIREP
jgi:hypothetical protein